MLRKRRLSLPAAGYLSMFLAKNGVREVEGLHVMDVIATVIKVAELLVDLKNIGIDRAGIYAPVKREDLSAFRKVLKEVSL